MTLTQSLSSGLGGAMLLARGEARGILLIEADPDGTARSFWAIPFSLPSVLYLSTLDWPRHRTPVQVLHALAIHAIVFVVAWLAFAVLSHRLAPRFRRAHLWPRMISAWNWCGVPENLLLVLGCVPGLLGAPHIVDQVSQVATFGWALWIEWFAFRLAFGAGPLLAAWLVMVDQSIGVVVTLAAVMLTAN